MFPKYYSKEFAVKNGCFNCSKPAEINQVEESQYPYGRGYQCFKCKFCGMTTWFDLTEKETENGRY
jgi:hypothetical protein